jgi:hypothetical protein
VNPRHAQQLDVRERDSCRQRASLAAAAREGEWTFREEPHGFGFGTIVDDAGRIVLDVGHICLHPDANRAIGLLAASAPRLLDLLRQYRNDMMFPDLDAGQRARRIEAIDAAIAKAEGRVG